MFSFTGYTLAEIFRKPDNWQIYKQTGSAFHTWNDVSKTYWEEKNIKMSCAILITFEKMQKQPPDVFYV